uniref:PB1 domain-containing protein n=1 Tax=Parascaris univalens TaxID=6257 RepID=A0A915BF64_PARUN
MSQSAQFKWFNGDRTRRFEIPYEDVAKLFDKLIAKMTQYGFEHGKENVFWIDTDGDYILLEDSESMEIALNVQPSEGVILLESYASEDIVFTGERKARPRNRLQMPPRGRRPGPPHYPRLFHDEVFRKAKRFCSSGRILIKGKFDVIYFDTATVPYVISQRYG